MYLRIMQGSKEDHLRKINQLLLKIFAYAAQAATFDSADFEQFVKKDEVWSEKSYNPGNPFYNKIKKLFDFLQVERENIYKSVQHDMEFDCYIDDPDFVFEELQLKDEQKEAIKKLVLHLYDNLFRKDKLKFQGKITGYRQFKDSLFEHNKSCICPVCLTMQTNLKEYGEVDHYFPKVSYPALIFHPINLAVICGECNGLLVKGEKDVFKESNLTQLYIPYLRHAEEEVELKVKWVEENGEDEKEEGEKEEAVKGEAKEDDKTAKVRKMVMVPSMPDANGLIEKRIQNLDNLYDLSTRWTDRMNSIIEFELEDLEEEHLESEVAALLHNRAKEQQRWAARNKAKLLEATTFEHIENEGRERFMAEWRMRQDEKMIMDAFKADT